MEKIDLLCLEAMMEEKKLDSKLYNNQTEKWELSDFLTTLRSAKPN